MKFNRKFTLRVAAVAAVLLCVIAIGSILVLQSSWFRDQVRRRIVAQVEESTGGRVEIEGFEYDWRNLTADLKGFTIHGTEPPEAAPLLRVEGARVTIRIISLLERSADVSSIVLTRPQVNLIVAADGSTNLPMPRKIRNKKDPIQQLFALKLRHFEVSNGLITASDKRIPLNFRGDGVDLVVSYVAAVPSYAFMLNSRQVDLGFGDIARGPLRLSAEGALEKDRAVVQKLEITGSQLRVFASGGLRFFAHPKVDFAIDSTAAVNEILPLAKVANIRNGTLALRGNGRYDEAQGWTFNGRAGAQQAGYYSRGFTLKSIDASADVEARRSGLVLRHLSATALGAKLNGEASIRNYRNLVLDGNVSDLTLRETASFFTNKPLAWQGVASGRVHVAGSLDRKANDLAVQGELAIAPGRTGIPVSGAVQLSYLEKTGAVEFGKSRLNFPSTTVSFSGTPKGQTKLVLDSGNLEDIRPVVSLIGIQMAPSVWPQLLGDGRAHFDGLIDSLLGNPKFDGRLEVSQVRLMDRTFDALNADISAGSKGVSVDGLELRQGEMEVAGGGQVSLTRWAVGEESPLSGTLNLRGVSLGKLAAQFPKVELPLIQGTATASIQLRGTIGHPEGSAHVASDSLDAYGERLNQAQFYADVTGDRLEITNGKVTSGAAVLAFSGDYLHNADTWKQGQARIKVDSNGFPLASLSPVRKYQPQLNAQAEVHLEAAGRFLAGKFEPAGANGTIDLRNIKIGKQPYGNLTVRTATRGLYTDAVITGDLRKNPLRGTAAVELTGDNKVTAEIDFDRITVESVYALTGSENAPLFQGSAAAKLRLEGPLQRPDQFRATLRSDNLQLSSKASSSPLGKPGSPVVSLHNSGPLVIEAINGLATIRSFRVEGDNTSIAVSGTIPYQDAKPMDLRVAGSVNLQAYHLFDPNVESSGVSIISASIGGTLRDPMVSGTLQIKDGAFFPENIPNGLSAVNGTVTFNKNRATLQKMTAKSGGGDLALGGFLSFGGGGPLVYHLEGSADNVRVRYAGTISVTSNAKLRLSGTSTSSLLSGTITVSRVVFNANTDVGNIVAGLGFSGASSSENDFLSGLRMDIVVESAPNLQLSTSLSHDVEAEIDLRLRGTPDHPVVLGSLSANQGDIQAFGSRYTINRGEITFSNPVKIEPILDLDLETRARGVTVDIAISGPFSKLNIAYRSDPPLQPREIIALLAVGRAPDSSSTTKNIRTNDVNALQSGANSLLGAAVTSPVTNRLSKLFGITNIKIDPLVQGLTNTPQARVTLEQQISRDITITYITNLSQTSEQIFRFEWAFSRQFSVVALRDDNGEFGIDFQFKKRFK